MGLLLSACGTLPDRERSTGQDPIGSIISRETGVEPAPVRLGPPPATFLGRRVVALEQLLGSPDLIRREGPNEFRRYDQNDCRIYAVVAPAGGVVQTLSTGPLANGETAPDFETCTAGL